MEINSEKIAATHEGATRLREFASSIEASAGNIVNDVELFKKKVTGYEQLDCKTENMLNELHKLEKIFSTHSDHLHKLAERMNRKADEIDEMAGWQKVLVKRKKR